MKSFDHIWTFLLSIFLFPIIGLAAFSRIGSINPVSINRAPLDLRISASYWSLLVGIYLILALGLIARTYVQKYHTAISDGLFWPRLLPFESEKRDSFSAKLLFLFPLGITSLAMFISAVAYSGSWISTWDATTEDGPLASGFLASRWKAFSLLGQDTLLRMHPPEPGNDPLAPEYIPYLTDVLLVVGAIGAVGAWSSWKYNVRVLGRRS